MNLERFREPPGVPFFSVTAMIDVLFLMIIFLVLGANFDSTLSVELPRAGGAQPRGAPLRVQLTVDGSLLLSGARLAPGAALPALRALAPRSVLLLPDRRLSVEALLGWYDLLGRELDVPIAVGVRPPLAQ